MQSTSDFHPILVQAFLLQINAKFTGNLIDNTFCCKLTVLFAANNRKIYFKIATFVLWTSQRKKKTHENFYSKALDTKFKILRFSSFFFQHIKLFTFNKKSDILKVFWRPIYTLPVKGFKLCKLIGLSTPLQSTHVKHVKFYTRTAQKKSKRLIKERLFKFPLSKGKALF